MFIKQLIIYSKDGILREMSFSSGVNLIIDDTPLNDQKLTGNNVGKTTVLKLIYFCLSGKGDDIFTDEENRKEKFNEVKNFLFEKEVLIKLVLTSDLHSSDARELIIERNFLKGKQTICRVNHEDIAVDKLDLKLSQLIFPNYVAQSPTFRQLISHNFRYTDDSINHTLKTLPKFTKDVEYEALYLNLLGMTFNEGYQKKKLLQNLADANKYKKQLKEYRTTNEYEIELNVIQNEIDRLNEEMSNFKVRDNYDTLLDKLNEVRYEISKCSLQITQLENRKKIIIDAKTNLNRGIVDIDLDNLSLLYNETKLYKTDLQKTFDDLVNYHNNMLHEKVKFITKELPSLKTQITTLRDRLDGLLKDEKDIIYQIDKSNKYINMNEIIDKLNQQNRKKVEIEVVLDKIKETESNIKTIEDKLSLINNNFYKEEFEQKLKQQINKFNSYFSEISNKLYGEKFVLKFEREQNKRNKQDIYKFSSFNVNVSSGKKQGEILCFDLAYIKFADEENIPCLHFLLNDKKELLHDNQLLNVSKFIKDNNIQLICSILKDKLPKELLEKANIVVKLSQQDKLFKM